MQEFLFTLFRACFAVLCTLGICLLDVDALACGRDTDCRIGERVYRVVLPPAATSPAPRRAVIFVHGYMGTAKNVLRNKDLVAVATKHGAAFVAAQAVGIEWNVPGVPSVDATAGVDELKYFDRVAADLKQRFSIRRKDIIVAGFSSGAMMVWHLACHRGDTFAGFVAFSGTFWKPLPKSCPLDSINLIHYHGKSDTIVPIHGRQIKDGFQGDVYEAMALLVRAGKFGAAQLQNQSGLDCKQRENASGNVLELCLFAGGHELRASYLERAWRKLLPKHK
jgi:polyhydroxybutyrate depolymerase